MAKNFKQAGNVLQWTNGTGSEVKSGSVVVMGAAKDATIGIALVDIASTESGAVQIDGVFELAKVSAAVFNQGETLIWDSSAAAFDDNAATPAIGDVSGAVIAAASGLATELTCLVKLTGHAGTLKTS